MDNFDFVGHLAQTANANQASVELVESFVRSYYSEIHAVEAKWAHRSNDHNVLDLAFRELNEVYHRYWLPGTRFTEYWQPALASPPDHIIASDDDVIIYQDMLGNFIAVVCADSDRKAIYLISVVRDELKIINQFF